MNMKNILIVSLLVFLNVISAISVIFFKHENKELYKDLEQLNDEFYSLQTTYGRLQLEQSAYIAPGRIEGLAREKLEMVKPSEKQTRRVIVP